VPQISTYVGLGVRGFRSSVNIRIVVVQNRRNRWTGPTQSLLATHFTRACWLSFDENGTHRSWRDASGIAYSGQWSRFPHFGPSEDDPGYVELQAGVLTPEGIRKFWRDALRRCSSLESKNCPSRRNVLRSKTGSMVQWRLMLNHLYVSRKYRNPSWYTKFEKSIVSAALGSGDAGQVGCNDRLT
jgi:hypothetical protein